MNTKPSKRATKAPPKPASKTQLGKAVADFSVPSTGGQQWRLRAQRGHKLVLYFYPRDNTSGCTLEGQQFAALAPQFTRAGALIAGVSRDSLASHDKFRERMGFPFALLADEDGALCGLFDVIREKSLYGRKFMGIERSTFLIDAKGVLRHEWRKVKVDGHAAAVLEATRSL